MKDDIQDLYQSLMAIPYHTTKKSKKYQTIPYHLEKLDGLVKSQNRMTIWYHRTIQDGRKS